MPSDKLLKCDRFWSNVCNAWVFFKILYFETPINVPTHKEDGNNKQEEIILLTSVKHAILWWVQQKLHRTVMYGIDKSTWVKYSAVQK